MEWQIWMTGCIIFCIRYLRLFWVCFEKACKNIDNPSITIYVNKTENRLTFKIKTGYYLELLTPETMRLFGKTENKRTKDKYSENIVKIYHTLKLQD